MCVRRLSRILFLAWRLGFCFLNVTVVYERIMQCSLVVVLLYQFKGLFLLKSVKRVFDSAFVRF